MNIDILKLYLKHAHRVCSKVLRNPQTTKHYTDLYTDYRTLVCSVGPVFTNPVATSLNEKKVLVVSMTNDVRQFKQEAIFAKALEFHGYHPVILTSCANWIARRYFKHVFGIESFIFLDDYLPAYKLQVSSLISSSFGANDITYSRLKRWKFEGVCVGQQVLSSYSRYMRSGEFKFNNESESRIIRKILTKALETTLAAKEILGEVKPNIVMFCERGYAGITSFYDLALERGCDVVQFIRCYRDDAVVLKRYTVETRRVHPNSLASQTWQRISQMEWTNAHEMELMEDFYLRYRGKWFSSGRDHIGKKFLSAEHIQKKLGLDSNKRTAIVFSHVLWDANMFYGEDLFQDFEEWLIETTKAACSNMNVNWIIKLHPANVWKARAGGFSTEEPRDAIAIRENVGELPSHVKLMPPDMPINTYSLFPLMDFCITVRGTIGMEAPCFGIPTITGGTGRYSGYGFTVDPKTRDEYISTLQNIHEMPPLSCEQTLLAKKHAYGIFILRPLRLSSFTSIYKSFGELDHPLHHNVAINIGSRDELKESHDLREFSAWAIDSTQLDYIDHRRMYDCMPVPWCTASGT